MLTRVIDDLRATPAQMHSAFSGLMILVDELYFLNDKNHSKVEFEGINPDAPKWRQYAFAVMREFAELTKNQSSAIAFENLKDSVLNFCGMEIDCKPLFGTDWKNLSVNSHKSLTFTVRRSDQIVLRIVSYYESISPKRARLMVGALSQEVADLVYVTTRLARS